MKVISAVDKNNLGKLSSLDNVKNAIFLAGPCPRKNYEEDWRTEAIETLKKYCFDGIVLNPTNPYFDSIDLNKQTTWEYEAMHKASAILFWIPRTEEHPAFTTNLELGQWWGKKGVFVGYPKDSIKNEYIGVRMQMMKQKVYDSLDDICYAVASDLDPKTPTDYFTSDTHFSQQRTLELSRRPFMSVKEMDLELISNWNKKIRMCDTVYHDGDFGETFDYLNLLNFDKFNLVLGNYEKKSLKEYQKQLDKFYNVSYFDNDELEYESKENKMTYTLRHEPLINNKIDKDKFYLFGHIHGRDEYKRNGLDIGIDGSNYAPLSIEEVDWRANAVLKYVDDNVFTEYCK